MTVLRDESEYLQYIQEQKPTVLGSTKSRKLNSQPWLGDTNGPDNEDLDTFCLNSQNCFGGHGDITKAAETKILEMRKSNLVEPYPSVFNLYNKERETEGHFFQPFFDICKSGLLQEHCQKGQILGDFSKYPKIPREVKERCDTFDGMACCIDGTVRSVFRTGYVPKHFPEVGTPVYIDSAVLGYEIYKGDGLVACTPELVGKPIRQTLASHDETMRYVKLKRSDSLEQKVLTLDALICTQGLRYVRSDPIKLEDLVMIRPLDLVQLNGWFDVATEAAKSNSRREKLEFKVSNIFMDNFKRRLSPSQAVNSSFAQKTDPCSVSTLKALEESLYGKIPEPEITLDSEEVQRTTYESGKVTSFWPTALKMRPLDKDEFQGLRKEFRCKQVKKDTFPMFGFWEFNSLIANNVCALFAPSERNRPIGRRMVMRRITDRFFIYAAVDHRTKLEDSSARYFLFWIDDYGTAHEVDYHKMSYCAAEEHLHITVQAAMVCLALNPLSIPWWNAMLLACCPDPFAYDLLNQNHMLKSDDRSAIAFEQGSYLPQLLSLAKEKMYNGGPTTARDQLLCYITLLGTYESLPSHMFNAKFSPALIRWGRWGIARAAKKSCIVDLLYRMNDVKVQSDPATLNGFSVWLKKHVGEYFDIEEVQKWDKEHPVSLERALTMNAALAFSDKDEPISTSCTNAVYAYLEELALNEAADVPALSSLEYIVKQILPISSNMYNLFAKVQANGQRPIAKCAAPFRLKLSNILQISTALGKGQNIDCVTRPEDKHMLVAKHQAFARKWQAKGSFTGHLFLDMTNFCGFMDIDACTLAMGIICNHCFPGAGVYPCERTKLYIQCMKDVKTRVWVVPMSTIEGMVYGDMYQEGAWVRGDLSRLFLKELTDEKESFYMMLDPVMEIYYRNSPAEGPQKLDLLNPPQATNGFQFYYIKRNKIISWRSGKDKLEPVEVGPDAPWIGIKKVGGSEEGQVMEMESVAFGMILSYIMDCMGIDRAHRMINLTSDDVLITYATKPVDFANSESYATDAASLGVAIIIQKELQRWLRRFHIYLSVQKASISCDHPETSQFAPQLLFNSSMYKNRVDDPFMGEPCMHVARELNKVFSFNNCSGLQDSLNSTRSNFITFMKSFPWLDESEFAQVAFAKKIMAKYEWGTALYAGMSDSIPSKSAAYDGCPTYTQRSDLYQDPIGLELEHDFNFKNLLNTDVQGNFKVDCHVKMDYAAYTELQSLKTNAFALFAKRKWTLAAELLHSIGKRASGVSKKAEWCVDRLRAHFGHHYKGGMNIVEAYETEPRDMVVLNSVSKSILDRRSLLDSRSTAYLVTYSGFSDYSDHENGVQFLKTAMIMCDEKDQIADINLDKWMKFLDDTVLDEPKMILYFVKTTNLVPLIASVSDMLVRQTLEESVKTDCLPCPNMATEEHGIQLTYSPDCTGDWFIGREGKLMAVLSANGMRYPGGNEWLRDPTHYYGFAGGVDLSSLNRLQVTYCGSTALHSLYYDQNQDGIIDYYKTATSKNLQTLFGFGMIQRHHYSIRKKLVAVRPIKRVLFEKDTADFGELVPSQTKCTLSEFKEYKNRLSTCSEVAFTTGPAPVLDGEIDFNNSDAVEIAKAGNLMRISSEKWTITIKPKAAPVDSDFPLDTEWDMLEGFNDDLSKALVEEDFEPIRAEMVAKSLGKIRTDLKEASPTGRWNRIKETRTKREQMMSARQKRNLKLSEVQKIHTENHGTMGRPYRKPKTGRDWASYVMILNRHYYDLFRVYNKPVRLGTSTKTKTKNSYDIWDDQSLTCGLFQEPS